ncbi:MAG: hypothetical protein WCS65_03685 [Verrucomicrobiae bacterium]
MKRMHPIALGFLGDKFEFCRFATRYRMAVRFTGIQLEGFGENTERGYSALRRTLPKGRRARQGPRDS